MLFICGYLHLSVVITDNQPPRITCPEDIQVFASSDQEEVLFNEPIVEDNNIQDVTLSSNHQSGDSFPVGITMVEFTASDSAFKSICSFEVNVYPKPLSPVSNPATESAPDSTL